MKVFTGQIESRTLKLDDPQSWFKRLLELDGEKVTLKIEKRKKPRSLGENSYFHAVVCTILADELGYTPQEVKGVLKWKFKIKSTADLSTVEFEKFMKDVREWASIELSIYIPSPHEDITQLFTF